MIIGFHKKASNRKARIIALSLTLVFLAELVSPTAALALTGGPSQPEFGGFAQASATDMVDLFTGNFSYNLPLFDIDGYPVNLSYAGGVGMEQEASWVGLGWNLNPGMVSRTVRGIPDDFKGEAITEKFHIKPKYKISLGSTFASEIIGLPLSIGAGKNLTYSTGRGFYLERSVSLTYPIGGLDDDGNQAQGSSAGISISSSPETGLTLTPSLSITKDLQGGQVDDTPAIGISASYNSRNGLQNIGLSYSIRSRDEVDAPIITDDVMKTSFPINPSSYFPSQTPTTTSAASSFSGKTGGGAYAIDGTSSYNGYFFTEESVTSPPAKNAFGYFYHQDAGTADLTDFNRDGDNSHFTTAMKFLPPSSLMPDVYTVQGQGISGAIRPYRMEVSAFADPTTNFVLNANTAAGAEFNPGGVFDGGADISVHFEEFKTGAWSSVATAYNTPSGDSLYQGQPVNSLEQNLVFFKANELRQVNNFYYSGQDNSGPDYASQKPLSFKVSSPSSLASNTPVLIPKRHSFPASDEFQRLSRKQAMRVLTAEEARYVGLTKGPELQKAIVIDTNSNQIIIDSLGSQFEGHYEEFLTEKHSIAEISSTGSDGSRYVFGLPAQNKYFEQATFNIDRDANDSSGLVDYNPGTDNSISNSTGDQFFHGKSYDADYAHSFLLTGYLGPDYVDADSIRGISDGDLGTAVKFNWTQTDSAFNWRAPFGQNKGTFIEGLLLDETDNKATYTYGTKDVTYLHSIESKNHIAFFILSDRRDGLGVLDKNGAKSTPNPPKKLDEVRVYTKGEWQAYLDNTIAAPVATRTIEFYYDYSLCQGVTNFSATAGTSSSSHVINATGQDGKLTLKKVVVKNGNSARGELSPYVFDYSSTNPDYDPEKVDRWGNYKGTNPGTSNFRDYPYVNEITAGSSMQDAWASAWSLTDITLPSGGAIRVTYEADQYAYVQDKAASMMFKVKGIGASDCSSTSISGQELYKNTRESSHKSLNIYVDNPFPGTEAADFLDVDDPDTWLYFRFKVKLPGIDAISWNASNQYEDIRGYTKVSDIELCNDSTLRIKMQPAVHRANGNTINPILKAALDFTFTNYQTLLYGGISPNDNEAESTVKNIVAIKDEITSLFTGPYQAMMLKGIGKTIDPEHSYVRLRHPLKRRYGGGHRVAKIELTDGWDTQSNGAATTYGQEYSYEDQVTDESYGVASYEPEQGNDENPFKKPHYYSTDDSNSKKPKPMVYQEEPVGEMFLPSAVVGYSKVVVRPLHQVDAKSTGQYTEHGFYTAKDFPFKIDWTKLSMDDDQNQIGAEIFGISWRKSEAATAQGFVFVLNDMHGKPRYELTEFEQTGYESEPLKRTDYRYFQDEKGNLINEVPAIDRNGDSTLVQLGLDVDIAVDSREAKSSTHTEGLQINVKSFIWPFPTTNITLPPILPVVSETRAIYQSAVITKQIMQKGILREVEYFDGLVTTTLTNELFDAETAEVVTSSTTTEYHSAPNQDIQYAVNYPAYFAQDRMGPAYRNAGFIGRPRGATPFLTSATYNDQVKGNAEKEALVKSLIYRGYLDGLDTSCWNPPIYSELFGNIVPAGVFEEGDQVLLVEPEAEFGEVYHVAEVLTEEELQALLALAPSPPTNPLSNYTSPGSVSGNNVTSTFTPSGTTFCGGFIPDHPVVQEVMTRIVAISNQNFDFSMVPLAINPSSNVHWGEIDSVLFAHDAKRFFNIWDMPSATQDSFRVDYYNLVSQFLLDDDARDFLAYLDYESIDSTFNFSLLQPEPTRVQALLHVLNCPELRNCLMADCQMTSVVDALDGLFGVANGNTPAHGMLSAVMANNWTSHYIATSEAAIGGSQGCDFVTNKYYDGSGYQYDLKTYRDLFLDADANGFYGSLLENPPLVSTLANPNLPSFFSTLAAQAGYAGNWGATPFGVFGVWDDQCQPVSSEAIQDVYTTSCSNLAMVSVDSLPGLPIDTLDPTVIYGPPASYNTPDIGELAMFIDSAGVIHDLEGKTLKIMRSGRRNMQSAKVADETSLDTTSFGAPDFPYMLSASAMTFKDEWATDMFSESDAQGTFNAFLTGHRGVFRPHMIYQPQGKRDYTYFDADQNSRYDGRLNGYVPYWLFDTDSLGDTIYNRIVINPNADDPHSMWVRTEEFMNYSGTGAPIESKNAIDIYSTLLQSSNNHMVAEGVNLKHREGMVEHFENYSAVNALTIGHGTANATVQTSNGSVWTIPSSFDYLIGQDAHSGAGSLALRGTTLGTTSNSINYSSLPYGIRWKWDMNPASSCYNDDFYRIKGFAPIVEIPERDYVLSFWVKSGVYLSDGLVSYSGPVSFDPDSTLARARVVVSNSGANDVTYTMAPTGGMVDGWQRMDVTFTVTNTQTDVELIIEAGPFGCMVDDLRMHPLNAKMLTYVYDKTYRRLSASLDENNLGVFFRYDQDGSLMKTERETESGRLTVKEQKQSNVQQP